MNDLKLDNHEKRRRGIKKEAWDFFVLRGIKKKKRKNKEMHEGTGDSDDPHGLYSTYIHSYHTT